MEPTSGQQRARYGAPSSEPGVRRCREPLRRGGEELNGAAFYRKYTEGMLRRYLRVSMEVGRVPSCMPKELFRGKVSSHRMRNFEDGVIFAHDMESCLERLDVQAVQVLVRVVIQEFSYGEAAEMLGCSTRQVLRVLYSGLDALTDLLLERGLLRMQWHG